MHTFSFNIFAEYFLNAFIQPPILHNKIRNCSIGEKNLVEWENPEIALENGSMRFVENQPKWSLDILQGHAYVSVVDAICWLVKYLPNGR